MIEIIMQYILIVLLVVGLGYLVYLLKDKGINVKEDYFGLIYMIFGSLEATEATTENVKLILRAISEAVKYVEDTYKDADNTFKEESALKLAKEALALLNLKSTIEEESIRYMLRIAAAFLPPTHIIEKIVE